MRPKGFTLLELMMSLGVIALLFTLTYGAFHLFYQQQQAEITGSQLYQALQLARETAMTRNEIIGICGIDDRQQCTSDWSKGWMLFIRESQQCLHLNQWDSINGIHSAAQPIFYFTPEGRSLTRGSIQIDIGRSHRKLVVFDSGRVRWAEDQTVGETG